MTVSEDVYLSLPLVVTCLHFELFCMSLAAQPTSYIRVVLKSYKSWIQKVLHARLKSSADQQLLTHSELTKNKTMLPVEQRRKAWRQELVPTDKYDKSGEPIEVNVKVWTISFTNFLYEAQISLNDDERASVQALIEGNFLTADHVPTKFKPAYKSLEISFSLQHNNIYSKSPDEKPVQVAKGFVVPESRQELVEKTPDTTDSVQPQKVVDDALKLSDALYESSCKMVMLASFTYMGQDALALIERLLDTPNADGNQGLTDLFLRQQEFARINRARIVAWDALAQEVKKRDLGNAIEQQIASIRERMNELEAKSTATLAEYDQLEKELAEQMPKDILSNFLGGLEQVGRELEHGSNNLMRESERFVRNLGLNLEKAVQDTGAEFKRLGDNVGIMIVAASGFLENQVRSVGKNLSVAERRVREGKIVDALWHIATDEFKSAEDNAAKAFADSPLLTSIASSVVSIYGAPYGGAVFAAWLTYKTTGNLEAALKAAVITYATQVANATAQNIREVEIDGLVKATLMTSAVGAAAIAAGGGTEQDIMNGFLKGAALSICSNAYKEMTTKEIEGRSPKGWFPPVYDKNNPDQEDYVLFINKNGEAVQDITKISRDDYSHVGIARVMNNQLDNLVGESSVPMRLLSKIPYMNDMAYFHDQWCAVQAISAPGEVLITIVPATILTVAGSERPVLDDILRALKNSTEEKKPIE